MIVHAFTPMSASSLNSTLISLRGLPCPPTRPGLPACELEQLDLSSLYLYGSLEEKQQPLPLQGPLNAGTEQEPGPLCSLRQPRRLARCLAARGRVMHMFMP